MYIREARGKFIQYKILNRYYYTRSRLYKMGIGRNDLCWKCQTVKGTLMHALWECHLVSPIWKNVLCLMQRWLSCKLPNSPRLCLLGDKTEVPLLNKHVFRVLNTALVTCARLILQFWKDPHTPTLKMWKVKMTENVACEKMLARLHFKNEAATEQWNNSYTYLSTN